MPEDSSSYKVIITSDATGLGAGANQAVSSLNKISVAAKSLPTSALYTFGKAFLGFFSIHVISSQIRQLINYGDAMENLARRTNISADVLQAWDTAAKMAGGSISDLTMAMRKLQIAQDSALAGQTRYQQAFRAFGVSMEELRSPQTRPEQLLERMIARMGAADRPGMQYARLVFGWGADRMAMFARNSFTEAANQARQFGLIIDGVTRVRMKALNDQLTILGKELQLALLPVVQALMPVLARLVASLVAAIETIKSVVKSLKEQPAKTLADLLGAGLRNNPFVRLGRGLTGVLGDVIERPSASGLRNAISDLIADTIRTPGRTVMNVVSGRTEQTLGGAVAQMLKEEVQRGAIDIDRARAFLNRATDTVGSTLKRVASWTEDFSDRLTDVVQGAPVTHEDVFKKTYEEMMKMFETYRPFQPTEREQPELVTAGFKPTPVQADQLARIGGYRGRMDMSVRIEQQQLDHLRRISTNTGRLVQTFETED